MKHPKGFGPRSTARGFTVSVLASPSPGVREVAIECPHGRFVVTVWPEGIFLSDVQLVNIAPDCIRWLAEHRDAVGREVYGRRPP